MKVSKSGLFLFELIVVIFLFTLSAAVCINIFANSYNYSTDSENLTKSSLNAMTVAEVFKDGDGDANSDVDEIVEALDSDSDFYDVKFGDGTGDYGRFTLNIYYDKKWENTRRADKTYTLTVSAENDTVNERLIRASIKVTDNKEALLEMETLKLSSN